MANAAQTWLRCVAPLFLSLIHARPVLQANHFTGKEDWGVRGFDGFVGPVAVRLGEGSLDAKELVAAPFFSGAEELMSKGTLHLVKATLDTLKGRWKRSLEIDGHGSSRIEEDYSLGLPVPASPEICTRFAVCFRSK